MTKKLRLGPGVSIDAKKFSTSVLGIIAKRGRGKSGLLKVLLEELSKAGEQFIVFDPMGIMWGLLSSFDGKTPSGHQAIVVGGKHQHIMLERTGGARVAKAVVESGASFIIDFSGMPKSAYRQFVTDFCETLFALNESRVHVVLEEAPTLVPQVVRTEKALCFDAVETLVSKGRNKGIGVTLVSQRSATIHKDVLTQLDTLVVLGLTAPIDRDALKAWVYDKGEAEKMKQFDEGLASLKRQHAWIWSPERFELFRAFRVRDFTTFHPDIEHLESHGFNAERAKVTDVASVIAKLNEDMKKLEQKEQDVAVLRKRLRELEKAEAPVPGPVRVDERATERAVREALDAERKRVNGLLRALETQLSNITKIAKDIEKCRIADLPGLVKQGLEQGLMMDKIVAEIRAGGGDRPHGVSRDSAPLRTRGSTLSPSPPGHETKAPQSRPPVRSPPSSGEQEDGTVRPKEVEILRAVAELQAAGFKQPTKKQIALWVGLRPTSGGFANYLGRLRSMGYLDYLAMGRITLTDRGRELAGNDIHPPSSPEEFQSRVFGLVGPSMSKILRVVIGRYPDPVPKPELAEECGHSPTSGGFANYLGKLRTLGVTDYRDGGVVALPVLFLEEDA